MRLKSANQSYLKEIEGIEFDLLLAASGFEERATFGSEKALEVASFTRKAAMSFRDRRTESRLANDKRFHELGFDLIDGDGGEQAPVREVLNTSLDRLSIDSSVIRIFIDYSSMTKTWYAAVLNWIREIENDELAIEAYFSYSCSTYSAPRAVSPNAYAGAIRGFSSLSSPRTPTALILGLGYQTERAVGLVEYLEPDETYLFYTDPASDKRFVRSILKNNHDLIQSLGDGRKFPYPYANLRTASLLLASLSLGLTKSHRLILAPLGPKPFSLLCLLLACEHPDHIDVWRVGSGVQGQLYPRSPSGELIICKTTFSALS